MIKAINVAIRVLLTAICVPMWWLNVLIVVIMWNGNLMVVHKLVDMIWDKPQH